MKEADKRVQIAINSELVFLYWNIGKFITTEVLKENKAEYGKTVISSLSDELSKEYGRGYSQRNLFNMVRFFETINDEEILQTLSAKLSWSHFVKLIIIEDNVKRNFYLTMAANER